MRTLADIPHGQLPTSTGKTVNLFALRPKDIDIHDIAHHLSMLCRWTGATREFYSVAEHSLAVSRAVPRADALWGLLHDAPEAYLGDVSWTLLTDPILGPRYRALHTAAMATICEVFGLSPEMPASVHAADRREAERECGHLWRPPIWNDRQRVDTLDPGSGASDFLNRFKDLTKGTA